MAASLPRSDRRTIVVMGVSGCGKSTVGAALAAALGLDFIDGDDLHGPANIAKMSRGDALTDADRAPWLDRVGAALGDVGAHPAGLVIGCSALKRAYRDRIRGRAGAGTIFVFLDGPPGLMAQRMAARPGHFMPATLIDSQFAALERPTSEEGPLVVADVGLPVSEIVARAVAAIEAD